MSVTKTNGSKNFVLNPWVHRTESMGFVVFEDYINGWRVDIPKRMFPSGDLPIQLNCINCSEEEIQIMLANLVFIDETDLQTLRRGLLNSNVAIPKSKKKINQINNIGSENIIVGLPYHFSQSGEYSTHFAPRVVRQLISDCIFDQNFADMGDVVYDFEEPFSIFNRRLFLIFDKLFRRANRKIILLGGDHVCSLLAIDQFSKLFDKINVVVFDAHHDAYGVVKEPFEFKFQPMLSNANILPRILANNKINKVVHLGLRDHIIVPDHIQDNPKYTAVTASNLQSAQVNSLSELFSQSEPTYVSIDLDVLDPLFFRHVNYPESGGITPEQLLSLLGLIYSKTNTFCVDLVEYAFQGKSNNSEAILQNILKRVFSIHEEC